MDKSYGIWLSFTLMVVCSFLNDLRILTFIMASFVLAILIKRLKIKRIMARTAIMYLLSGGLIVIMTILRNGWLYGLLLSMRLLDSLIIGFTLLEAYTEYQILEALRKLRMPNVLLDVMAFIVRYFGVISRESRKMWIARQSRAFENSHWMSSENMKEIGHMVAILFLKSYNRSLRIERSMVSRRGDL